jgi:hypothetical protein
MHLGMRVWRKLLDALDQNRTPILLASLFLILLGTRAALISYAGSPTPFTDEWEADGARLLKPYVQGNLTISDLFIPLNEHRIFFTKLLVLLIFNVSGYWDVVLQMIVNSILDSATVVAIAYALSRVLRGGWTVAAIILSTLINAVPFGYDNAVLGFNTHFYLLLTFSFAGLWFLVDSRAWSWRWAAGVLCAVGSSLCLASGALTFAAAGGAQLLQMWCGRRAGLREGLGIATLVAMTVVLASVVPHVPEAEPEKAHSIGQFLSALLALASWPAHSSLGMIFTLPTALFLLRTVADRPALSDPRWFNVMMVSWVASQTLALAAGRALHPLQNRYFDILLVGLTINLVSAFWLFQLNAGKRNPMTWRSFVLAAWLFALTLSLTHPQRHLPSQIEEWRTIFATGSRNVQRYLATGERSFLSGAPAAEVPSFFPERLRELLDTPEIRSTLPPALLSIEPPHTWVEAFKSGFLRLSSLWIGTGTLLLILVVTRMARTAAKPSAHRPSVSSAILNNRVCAAPVSPLDFGGLPMTSGTNYPHAGALQSPSSDAPNVDFDP